MAIQQDRDSSLRAEIVALQRRVQVLEAEAVENERMRLLLREEHSFRKGVIERAAEGICVCHAIPEYPFIQFTVWNDRMKDITGYSIEEINRLGWYQSMYPDPEIQERARQRMKQMREGEDLRYERWEITRADREKRTLGISTSILTTNDGLIHVLALMQDVTDEERYRRQLERRVVKLEGLLPICASCKKIRDDKGVWHQLEVYIRDHSEADFTHSICSDCAKELYHDFKI
ncbi:MAG: multi-sensor hybrid histidine kinase [Candidatus Brocadiaceae bacterium]|nr:multi-sensor hybrid histidine kinase [Candidatus Brocadiaceae bacterium]